jgi:hypothetical protein
MYVMMLSGTAFAITGIFAIMISLSCSVPSVVNG